MRQFLLAALGLILTAPVQSALARDHSHHVRSHSTHAHHARLARHHVRHHRHARVASLRLVASPESYGQPYGHDFGAFQGGFEPSFRAVGRYGSRRYRYAYAYGYEGFGDGRAFAPRFARRDVSHNGLDSLISRHAQMNGIPESLLHRVVMRESRYNPRAVGRGGAMGLMQIKAATARAMGYGGSASGLLDPDTNITYAARYLAGAYRAAGGNADRAVSYYARGYYHQARARGFSPYGDGYGRRGAFAGQMM